MDDVQNQNKPKETKHEKFKRIAKKRVENAANQIRLIGNLSSKVNYDYTKDDVDQITAFLKERIIEMENRFATKKEETSSFTFRD
ncbi:MAG: hypothetical protein PUA61_09340 [Succinatimonas hippei]|nr:hypothetical protein [Succinatimonas hippei]